jgi:hypothetical protein
MCLQVGNVPTCNVLTFHIKKYLYLLWKWKMLRPNTDRDFAWPWKFLEANHLPVFLGAWNTDFCLKTGTGTPCSGKAKHVFPDAASRQYSSCFTVHYCE